MDSWRIDRSGSAAVGLVVWLRRVGREGVYFFVKDRQSRMVCGSQPFWDQTIAQIAYSFGFCDQSAFTQQFRKHISRAA